MFQSHFLFMPFYFLIFFCQSEKWQHLSHWLTPMDACGGGWTSQVSIFHQMLCCFWWVRALFYSFEEMDCQWHYLYCFWFGQWEESFIKCFPKCPDSKKQDCWLHCSAVFHVFWPVLLLYQESLEWPCIKWMHTCCTLAAWREEREERWPDSS